MTVITDNNGFDKVVDRLQREAAKNPITTNPLNSLKEYAEQFSNQN